MKFNKNIGFQASLTIKPNINSQIKGGERYETEKSGGNTGVR